MSAFNGGYDRYWDSPIYPAPYAVTNNVEDQSDAELAKQMCKQANENILTFSITLGDLIARSTRSYSTSLLSAVLSELNTGNYSHKNRDCVNALYLCASKVLGAIQHDLDTKRRLVSDRVVEIYPGPTAAADWWNTQISEAVQYTPAELWSNGNYMALIEAMEAEYLTWQISNRSTNT